MKPDFVDNITEVGGHKPLSLLCTKHRVPCICQKPMAASLADARAMVAAFAKTKTPLFVHENWRWQTPMRQLKRVLDSGVIGTPFRGRLTMISGFDIAHASIVDCHRDLLRALRGEGTGETTGADNLKSMELVFCCYESAAKGRVLHFKR